MANYFRLDMSNVQETNKGGRAYSVQHNAIIPNGIMGYLGSYVTGSTEVRTFVAPDATNVKVKLPVIIMKPEINYSQFVSTDAQLGVFRNPANKPVPAYQLKANDGIDLSHDYFDLTGKATGVTTACEVGDIFVLQANAVAGTQLKYSATAPLATASMFYFKVVGVTNSHIPNYVYSDGTMFPTVYKMVQLELVLV